MESQKSRCFTIAALVGFLLLTLWGFVGYWSFSERTRILKLTAVDLDQLRTSVEEQTLRLFKMTETSLLTMNDWVSAHPDTYPNDSPAFVALVNRQRDLSDGFVDFRTVDRDGGVHLIPSQTRKPVGNVAEHEDVRVQADPRTQGFYIGSPVLSPTTGTWIVPATYAADNRTTAVLAGIIELDKLSKFFEPQRMRPKGSITVIRADGTTLFRAPATTAALGKTITETTDFREHFAVSDRGVYRIRGIYDGFDRIVSFSKLHSYPLIVTVTASVNDVLASWRRETAVLCGLALAVTILTSLMTDRFLRASRAAHRRIAFLAYHDGLTGLPNRQLARDRFTQVMAHADHAKAKAAMLFLDLDHFKVVNDSLGHAVGDALIKGIAQRMGECVRETDTISRHGGDEFLILLADVRDNDAITNTAEKILKRLEDPFDMGGHTHLTSISIGISVYPEDGAIFDTLLKKADAAMYKAKEAGRNTYHFYNEEMNAKAVEALHMRNGLRQALVNDEFVLHYQPQIDLPSRRFVGVEALIRWNHPGLGLVAPGRFIHIAEESGLIVQIGEWAIREACRQAVAWRRAGIPEIVVAVNLSALQFRRGNLERTVTDALDEFGLPAQFLELELTESILIQDVQGALETVETLKQLGLKLSIDDFGTGYSSLSYLKRLKVDKLKIDQSFVRQSATNPEDCAIVRAIIQMAKSLNLITIAEGVEDEETLTFLTMNHCDQAQGYHVGRPMGPDSVAALLLQKAVSDGHMEPHLEACVG